MCYLSIVAVGSNAGYGGNFLERMQAWADNLYRLIDRCELDADITIVEWAPPTDRPQIHEVIKFAGPVKIITVPREIHDRLPNPHGERFFEYIAKNVGIRRASGRFILSTNPDNIYSETLIDRLRDLRSNCFYRVDRRDIKDGRVFMINYADGSVINGTRQENENVACPDADGCANYPSLGTVPLIHFNASGDFIMMAKSKWESIKGHPEVPYSLTVDGQTLYLAAKIGLQQVILPEPMYHQDHSRTPKYCPNWSDKTPFGEMNQNGWGLSDVSFDTRHL